MPEQKLTVIPNGVDLARVAFDIARGSRSGPSSGSALMITLSVSWDGSTRISGST